MLCIMTASSKVNLSSGTHNHNNTSGLSWCLKCETSLFLGGDKCLSLQNQKGGTWSYATHFAVCLEGEEEESLLGTMTPSILDTMAGLAKLMLSKSALGPFHTVFLTDTSLSGIKWGKGIPLRMCQWLTESICCYWSRIKFPAHVGLQLGIETWSK